ncbi:MAG: MltA domain-containing protein [Rhodospirillaceae bacterium]|jgi:membrane-bound lytic murein transglycosylase A
MRTQPGARDMAPRLEATSFNQLANWQNDRHGRALRAFARSCTALMKTPDHKTIQSFDKQFFARDWKDACRSAAGIDKNNHHAARWFFERWFVPHRIVTGKTSPGLFTGYYEAELNGSWRRTNRFNVPLYAKPTDLIAADLGQFSSALKGKHIAGRLRGNRLIPYHSRREIENGVLRGKGLELLWVDSVADAFFLHVQGSGRVKMTDGSIVRVGYAAKNGRPYVSIGRELIRRGAMAKENVSMQSIRTWLTANPHKASDLLAANPSYIFFRRLKGTDVIGAMGVGLTPGRSLAVDRRHVPLGAPLWLDTRDPLDERRPLRRLMIAQDTGGAIKGPVRGDIFWGFGAEAAQRAGQMKSRGTYYVLLPKTICC